MAHAKELVNAANTAEMEEHLLPALRTRALGGLQLRYPPAGQPSTLNAADGCLQLYHRWQGWLVAAGLLPRVAGQRALCAAVKALSAAVKALCADAQ